MNYDTLIDRKSWPANQYLSDDTLDHVQSMLAADFIAWLDSSPITQRQIVCWMADQDIAGWLPISRIYRDFNKSSRNLTDYLRKNRDNCIALARWVKHCSDARWTGVDGLYDQFVDWVAR